MLLIRHMRYPLEQGCVATIGNFDGLHKGHQAILKQLKATAKILHLPSVVVTFEPLPKEYFLKNIQLSTPLTRLTRFKEKWHYLKNFGIDIMVCLPFNEKLAQWRARQFVDTLLLEKLHVQHLIVGEDFRFGYQREGDLAFLQQYSDKYFALEIASVVYFEEQRISSTRVREALLANDMVLAEKLLGRPYSLLGKIIHGDKQARKWGIPTANLTLHRSILPTVLPIKGVYAVTISILANGAKWQDIKGVANVGFRPTISGFRHLLEVHLFDFNHNIYDCIVEVKFLHKLRNEQRFDTVDLLKQQIFKDVDMTKTWFEKRNMPVV